MKLYLIIFLMLARCGSQENFHDGQRHDGFGLGDDRVDGDMVFKASEVKDATMFYDSEREKLAINFKLQKENLRIKKAIQPKRETISFEKIQGQSATQKSETFSIKEDGLLDLLIVVDNSHTMHDYQSRLANIEPLLDEISNSQWQIGVVTSDSPCLRNGGKPFTRDEYTSNRTATLNKFRVAVTPGTNGHPVERGLQMAIEGMQGVCRNQRIPWVRENSKRAVLLVSDEENCGSASNEGCNVGTGFDYFGPDQYISELSIDTQFYGILHTDDVCGEDFYDVNPDDYYELVDRTGGIWGPICSEDYSDLLRSISRDVNEFYVKTFELENAPDGLGYVKVTIDGVEHTSGFSLQGREVTLDDRLAVGANTVVIDYSYGYQESFDDLLLDRPIDEKTLKVFVNGSILSPINYNVVGRRVEFLTQISSNAVVSGEYKEGGLLFDRVKVGTQVQIYGVKMNDVLMSLKKIEQKGENVIFKQVPHDGTKIEVLYNFYSEITTDYGVVNISEGFAVEGSALLSMNSGRKIPHTIQDGKVSVPRDHVIADEEVILNLDIKQLTDKFEIVLPNMPIDESVKLSHKDCVVERINDTSVRAICEYEISESVKIDYKYQTKVNNRFSVDPDPSLYYWKVWIDEERTSEFYFEGEFLVVNPNLVTKDSVFRVRKGPLRK